MLTEANIFFRVGVVGNLDKALAASFFSRVGAMMAPCYRGVSFANLDLFCKIVGNPSQR